MADSKINEVISLIPRRADRVTSERLVSTFVGIDNLVPILSSHENRVILGRRGTGKTHALQYVCSLQRQKGNIAVFIDLRILGSNSCIYSDQTRPFPERATVLLVDLLLAIHDALTEVALDSPGKCDLNLISPHLDRLAAAATATRVIGTYEEESTSTASRKSSSDSALGFGGSGSFAPNVSVSASKANAQENSSRISEAGKQVYSVVIGDVNRALAGVASCFPDANIWIMLDEWSSIPPELQPFLADLIRRTIFPIKEYAVQIAAIEQRSNFRIVGSNGSYIGIELGADAMADVDLDDFMVSGGDSDKALLFFQSFLFNHYQASEKLNESNNFDDSSSFLKEAFSDRRAFEELVKAAEGVPRDAINIVGLAAQSAGAAKISVQNVRVAARAWYQRDKANILNASGELAELLSWIIEKVIAGRKARAFLLEARSKSRQIEDLFDARLIHVLKKSVSSKDEPGKRYVVYKLDYGCYVDLIATSKAPDTLLLPAIDSGATVIVPVDDYRAIRRNILELSEFFSARGPNTE